MFTEKNNKIPVTVSFDDDFIELVEEVSKKNFCDRDTFIRRGTFELLEKIVPGKANSLKLARNSSSKSKKQPCTVQIDSRHENDISLSPAVFDDLQKECPKKAKHRRYFFDTIVRLGIEAHKRIKKAESN